MIGDPFDRKTQVGPLISETSFNAMQEKLISCKRKITENIWWRQVDLDDAYVTPAIVETIEHIEEMNDETFAPILYVMPYSNLRRCY